MDIVVCVGVTSQYSVKNHSQCPETLGFLQCFKLLWSNERKFFPSTEKLGMSHLWVMARHL